MYRSVSRWLVAAAVLSLATMSRASWIQFNLPNLTFPYGGTALAHLPDGRYLFGECGNMYLQNSWNNSAYSTFNSTPIGVDPSFISIWNHDLGVIGAGGSGFSPFYAFDPDNTLSVFNNVGTNYNFQGVFRDGGGLFVNGASFAQPTNAVFYMTLGGGTNKLVLADVSLYSAGMAIDGAGNLYVGDNDNGAVYKFTPLQLDVAITGTPLTLSNGTLVHDFGDGGNIGSLALDGLGRIWTAGWNQNGLKVYSPTLDKEFSYIPGLTNANYKVAAFARGGTNYIAYLNQADPGHSGSSQSYGFDLADSYAIPEAGSLAMLMLAGSIFGTLFLMKIWRGE